MSSYIIQHSFELGVIAISCMASIWYWIYSNDVKSLGNTIIKMIRHKKEVS